MKSTIGSILAVALLFVCTAYAADPAQEPAVSNSYPQITFEAGPIIMNRIQDNRAIWSSPGHQGSGDILKSSTVDDDWRVGTQARLTFTFPQLYIDLGGFLLPTKSSSTSSITATGSILETRPPSIWPGPSEGITAKYTTSTVNLDVNIGHQFTPWLSAYTGVRYIKLKEEYDLTRQIAEDINWKTKNSMVGPQIGAKADLLRVAGLPASSPWSLDMNVALAILHNDASSSFFDTALATSSAPAASFWTPAVAAEADLGLRLTKNIKVSVGYQMLYLSSVALATNQVGATSSFNASPVLFNSVDKSSVIYHGGVAKLIISLP